MINVAICDDEEGFLYLGERLIRSYMKNNGYQCCVDLYSSGTAFLGAQKESFSYDIIFLDINMSGIDGIETAKRIRRVDSKVFIVFLTAFASYSLEGYKVDAVRYLLKDSNTLEKSMEECLDTVLQKMDYAENKEIFNFLEGEISLALDEIIYIESNLHKLFFHLNKREMAYSMYEKLDVIEKKLQSFQFCRIHKSYLVNMKYVSDIGRYFAKLKHNDMGIDTISISQSRYAAVKEQFIFYQGDI